MNVNARETLSTPDRPLVRLSDVYKTFHAGTVNEVRPMRGISLDIAEGSFVIVLGGNGSGKSTLLNAIAGCFPIDSGHIELDGQEVSNWPEHRRASLIGRVFQNPFSGTAPTMSILDNFSLAAKRGTFRGLSWAHSRHLQNELRDRIGELKMGLEDRLDTAIGSLSGGQRQALTLLMATWLKPRLLLLDEHTAALDPKSADQVIALTDRIIARERLTTLMVTHSMQQAINLGDRIVMMHSGNVLNDFIGIQKQRLHVEDLLTRFENVRRRELLDESAAKLLRSR
ncbi:MAG TPA: ATP-binding cassette domain-containing protein, partial [Methylomicrobium sp.]|nr:ATP-binding cassette domain-containing protein [Methylomicrobium sp.]